MINVGVDVNYKSGDIFLFIVVCKCEYVILVEDLIRVGSIVNWCSGLNILLIVVCKGNNLVIVE